MKTKTLRLLTSVLCLLAAVRGTAQTLITTSTTIILSRQNMNTAGAASGYLVDDGVTLTLTATASAAGGAAFNLGADSVTLTIGPSGPGATGTTRFLNFNSTGQGGAIQVSSPTAKLTLTNVTFENNYATNNGGAIRNSSGGAITINNALFVSNTTAGNGGAMQATAGGTMTFSNVAFNGNTATSNGGAIQDTTGGVLTLTNASFDGNTAGSNGGAIQNQAATLTMTNATFSNNAATSSGGAIQNTNAGATATLASVTFLNNRANSNGGAIAEANGAVISLTDVLFQDNWAAQYGGGISNNSNVTPGAATLRLTGSNGVTDYYYVGNLAGGVASAATADALATGVANFAASAAAGGFYYGGTIGTTMTFDIAAGVTLTIGDPAAANRAIDSIASADSRNLLAKSGAGLMVVNADNSYYSGTFAVNAGKLLLGNAQATLGGIVNVASGATFGGAGTLTTAGAGATINGQLIPPATLNIASGATLQVGLTLADTERQLPIQNPQSKIQNSSTLAINGLANIADGATLTFGLLAGNQSDFLSLATGTLNLAGAATINLTNFTSGTFTLAQWSAGNLADAASLTPTVSGAAPVAGRTEAAFAVDSQQLTLVAKLINLSATWNGAAAGGAGTWSAGGGGWATPTADTHFQNGDTVTFASGGSLAVSGAIIATDLNVTGAQNLTFAGDGSITTDAASAQPDSIITNATGALTKTGAGTLTLANTGANNFTGGINLSGGALAFTTPAQLGLAATATLTFANTATLSLAPVGASLATPADTALNAPLVLSDAATHATFDIAPDAALTLNGALRGLVAEGAGSTFTKTGAGTLTLAADSSAFEGATSVSSGALLLSPGAALGGNITVNSGGILGGAGAPFTGPVAINTGGALQAGLAGNSTPAALNLNIGNLTLADGAMLNFQLFSGAANPAASVNSTLTASTLAFAGAGVTGSDITINLSDLYEGTFNLATFAAGNTAAIADFAAAHIRLDDRELSARESVITTVAGNTLSIEVIMGNQRITWTGAAGATWGGADDNWRNTANPLPFAAGDVVVFDNSDTAGARDIAIAGTQVRAAGMEILGSGAYRFTGGSLLLDATGAPAGLEGATGQLLVNTTGTVSLANTAGGGVNTFANGIRLVQGTLVAETDGALGDATTTLTVAGNGTLRLLGGGSSTANRNVVAATSIADGATLTIDTPEAASMRGAITSAGNGSLVKTGTGMLNLSTVDVSTLTVAQGSLMFQPAIPLVARESVNIQPDGAINATTDRVIQTPLLVNQGAIRIGRAAASNVDLSALTLAGDYRGDGGQIIISATTTAGALQTDQFKITGKLTGSLYLTLSAPVRLAATDTDLTWQPVTAGAIAPDATIDPRSTRLQDATWSDAYALGINRDTGAITYNKIVAPEIPPVIAADAAALLIGKAALDSIDTRFTALRHNLQTGPANAWLSGLHREDKLSTGVYDGTKATTNGAQAGVDVSIGVDGGECITLGLFADYAQNDMNCPQPIIGKTSATTKATGGGLYLRYQNNHFYWDAIARFAKETYDITVPGSGAGTFSTSGNSLAAAIAAGYVITGKAAWDLEPQIRLAYQTHKIDNPTDPIGRTYAIDRANSFEAQATLRLSHSFEWRKDQYFTPYVRGGVTWEMMGRTKVRVPDAAYEDGVRLFENDLGDVGGILEAGAALQLSRGLYAAASAAWYKTTKLETYTLNATLGLRW